MQSRDTEKPAEGLELTSEDTTWRRMWGVQLLLLAGVSVWAFVEREPALMLFSALPFVFFVVYMLRTASHLKKVSVSAFVLSYEKLKGGRGKIPRESVEKIEVRRTSALSTLAIHYRSGQGRRRLILSTGADLGGAADGLRGMGYKVVEPEGG